MAMMWMAVSAKDDSLTRQFNFKGDRLAVKEQAAEQALQLGIDYLDKAPE